MKAKTKTILLETYKKMYEAMKNSAEKKRIGKLIEELETSLFNTDVHIEDFK
jgi:hypothetical protein